jgi:Mlc titration factor MtfA (ptsG expression regulator)
MAPQVSARGFDSPALPEPWMDILARNASFRSRLDPGQQSKLDRAIQIFVSEKNWEGCSGMILQDEQRVTIAAHAIDIGFR